MNFSELGLSPKVLEAVTNSGYTTPTPIQAQAIYFDLDLITTKKQLDWEIQPGDDIMVFPRQRPPGLNSLFPALLRLIPFGL